MGFDFNADEVFAMAVQMEQNGQRFYRNAAEKAEGEDQKALLNRLADMEKDHEDVFVAMRSELGRKEGGSTVFDPHGEAELYLKALADTQLFFDKSVDVTSMEEILKTAIQAEKDSIVFYVGMQKAVPERLGKGKLDRIIEEEMGHVRLLGGELLKMRR